MKLFMNHIWETENVYKYPLITRSKNIFVNLFLSIYKMLCWGYMVAQYYIFTVGTDKLVRVEEG